MLGGGDGLIVATSNSCPCNAVARTRRMYFLIYRLILVRGSKVTKVACPAACRSSGEPREIHHYEENYARNSPSEAPDLNPGNTELKSFCPRCPRTSSLSTVRKSVVTARSRP